MARKTVRKVKRFLPRWVIIEKMFLKIEVVAFIFLLIGAAIIFSPFFAKYKVDKNLHSAATNGEAVFKDIDTSYKYFAAVSYFKDKNYLTVGKQGNFEPDKLVSRGELIKYMIQAKKVQPTLVRYRNCFKDVKEENFAPYVCFAKANGFITGYKDGTFKPNEPISIETALKVLAKIYKENPAITQTVTAGLNVSNNLERGLALEIIYKAGLQ